LLDDRSLQRYLPPRWKKSFATGIMVGAQVEPRAPQTSQSDGETGPWIGQDRPKQTQSQPSGGFGRLSTSVKLYLTMLILSWIFYATTAQLMWMFSISLPNAPIEALEPFRIANRYGLFGIMTRGRYEIEFQGSDDGQNWVPYPFLYKPQDPSQPPGIYAPYQPRFDWNLWFASLGSWREYPIVLKTEVRLLSNDSDVLNLFATNPFPNGPPRQIRAVIWQYWFTSMYEKRTQDLWWRRQFIGLYAPTIAREPDGTIHALEWPAVIPRE
jgi:lipase maturation factor 1